MKYPATLTPGDNEGLVVTFRDIPEAISQGETTVVALNMAADALLTAMDFYVEDRRPVPPPSEPVEGEHLIELPLSASAKVMLLNEMLTQKIRPADLARLMGIKPQEVNRIIDLGHATKIDTLAAAFKALGRDLDLVVR
jgi:antitoxin HicB